MKTTLTLGKRVIYTPSPIPSYGGTVIVPEPIRGTITEIHYTSPVNRRITYVVITDKEGKTHRAYESQLCTKYPKVYENFIY